VAVCRLEIGDRREFGLRRQVPERLVEQFAKRVGIDIADHGDPQPSLASTRAT